MDHWLEKQSDSNVDENTYDAVSNTHNSIAGYLQSPQFFETIINNLLPQTVDSVKAAVLDTGRKDKQKTIAPGSLLV